MSSSRHVQPEADPPLSPPGGILIYGEGLSRLASVHLSAIRQYVGSMAGREIHVATVPDAAAVGERTEVTSSAIQEPFDLAGMSEEDIWTLHKDMRRAESEPPIDDIGTSFLEALLNGMKRVAYDKPDEAERIFGVFANSTDADTRGSAAVMIYHLARTRPEAAVTIWERLIRDPDSKVADDACQSFYGGAGMELVNEGAITPTQALRLTRAYWDVEARAQGSSS